MPGSKRRFQSMRSPNVDWRTRPTVVPSVVVGDADVIGAPFYVMGYVEGPGP